MRIFHWVAKVGEYEVIGDGYILAENRKKAEEKLKFVPFHDKHENVEFDDDDCGYDGTEIYENGVAIRWCD